MELRDLVRDIRHFDAWPHPSKIRLFAWYLHSQRSKDRFGVGDINSCYDLLSLKRPGNTSQSLADLERQNKVLRDSRGWHLERTVREQLDAKYGNRAATVEVHRTLQELPAKLVGAERAYLDEALICFRYAAYRAAIVMCWNLAYDHLCKHIVENRLVDFNAAIPKRYPKETMRITSREDFQEWNESRVIEVSRTAGITSKSIDKVLGEKLTRRNLAAHPSGAVFLQLQAEEYILDLIQNAVLKIGKSEASE